MNHEVQRTKAERHRLTHAERHLHPFMDNSQLNLDDARLIVKGEGVYLWDAEGRRYLDANAGLICTAVGYGRKELIEAAARQMQELSYCSPFFNTFHPSVAEVSEKLFTLLPERYSRVLYTNSGSEANEVLIRVVRRYWDIAGKPHKKILISRYNGYHGSTVGAASLTGMPHMHAMGDLPIPGIVHVAEPYWFGYQGDLTEEAFGLQAAGDLERKILELGADNVAAFVAEPFQGSAGLIFPPSTYWPEITRICKKYDILLCADEVAGGFGRTGEWFAHQHFGFEPDTLSIAKGLTSGYVPMGGLVISRRIADALVGGGVFAHGLTYQGHPLAAAVAFANLALLDEGGIVAGAKSDTGPYLQRALRDALANHPMVGEIQGAGMAAAVQLAPFKGDKMRFSDEGLVAQYCMKVAQNEGLLCRPCQGRMVVTPALVATRSEIDELVGKLEHAIDITWKVLDIR